MSQISSANISGTLFAGLLALCDSLIQTPQDEGNIEPNATLAGNEILVTWVIAQELAIRFACALQSTIPEVYIPSGLMGAVGLAAMGSRLLRLSHAQTQHAFGIAELHAPRIQTGDGWRVTIQPTMLKDTIAWGAMAGVNAALLARAGFSGAPCGVLEDPRFQQHFNTLGQEWKCLELYMKPAPCCRYAIPAVRTALQLLADERQHRLPGNGVPNLRPHEVQEVRITTFREAYLLACDIPVPRTAEEAQYHVAWPVAAALVQGTVPGPQEVCDWSVEKDENIRQMCGKVRIEVEDEYTLEFPDRTLADVQVIHSDGRTTELTAKQVVNSPARLGSTEKNISPRLVINESDPDLGLCTERELFEKFERFAGWGVGEERANWLRQSILSLRGDQPNVVKEFLDCLLSPP